LDIEVVAPCHLDLSGVRMQFTALLPQFGAPAGKVLDADWASIEPHTSSLLTAGYGFSCVGSGDPADDIAGVQEMLSDWGWSATSPKPDWVSD
jgi:hypothetical protein